MYDSGEVTNVGYIMSVCFLCYYTDSLIFTTITAWRSYIQSSSRGDVYSKPVLVYIRVALLGDYLLWMMYLLYIVYYNVSDISVLYFILQL